LIAPQPINDSSCHADQKVISGLRSCSDRVREYFPVVSAMPSRRGAAAAMYGSRVHANHRFLFVWCFAYPDVLRGYVAPESVPNLHISILCSKLVVMLKDNIRKLHSRLFVAAFWLVVSSFSLSACGGSGSGVESAILANDEGDSPARIANDPETPALPSTDKIDSVVMMTNLGEIRLSLDSENSPNTVANFLEYVDAGHYDQTIFHRVIPGFMIQGGGFSVDFQRNQTNPPILNEASNLIENVRYTIAMARTPLAHSATDQFFINVIDNPFLNFRGPTDSAWGYTVFGQVTSGFDVVDRIGSVTTGAAGPFSRDVPVEPVIIETIIRN